MALHSCIQTRNPSWFDGSALCALVLARLVLAAAGLLCGGRSASADDLTAAGKLATAAALGDPSAQFCLGQRNYATVRNDPSKGAEALKWFRLSAAQGDARAEERLGEIYYSGHLAAQDYAEAAKWYLQSATQGDREAQFHLAQLYREGKGVPVDLQQARKWSETAAQAAPPHACVPITRDADQVPASSASASAGLQAYPALRTEAEKGDAAAQFQLGNRYFDERNRDPVKDAEAQKWLRLSAAQRYAPAEDRLASMYYFGRGVPLDYAEAARWYRLAAEHGNVDAMTRLGGMYRDGKGVTRDRDEEKKWVNKGREAATRPLRRRAYLGLGTAIAAAAAFAAGLLALQRNMLSRGPRRAVAIAVHMIGVALVVNTLVTVGLPELLFPKCSYGFLAASCDYQNPALRSFATTLRNWQTLNLIWTFMGMIGLILHALAIWYVVYVVRRIRHVSVDAPGPARL